MGVKGLWDILSDLCERKPLTYLTGKKVAIDLSGWVVQAIQCQGLNKARNPHLRNLFFRVSRLLELGVFPIFVTEGKPPAIKEDTIKSRNADRYGGNGNSDISRSYFNRVLKQCEDLLSTLGVPCVKSSGEAEAFCAFLCLKGVVSGVITEDNDAFLYGADVVYKDFSVEPNDSHVNVYCLKSAKNKYSLDQKKLVALALLLGCDYSKGVPGIGKETAVKLLNELNCVDILERFNDWKNLSESELFPGLESQPLKKGAHCNRCGHLGTSSKHKKEGCSACDSEITCYLPDVNKPCKCSWHKNDELLNKWKTELKIYKSAMKCPDFLNMKVVDEYLNFKDNVPADNVLDWTCPKLLDFQNESLNMLGWTVQYSFEKTLPLITSWQQYKLQCNDCDKSDFLCEPVEILKERSVRGDSYFEVKWKFIDEDCDLPVPRENLITTEYGDRFAICYKDLVDDFFQQLNEQKEAKKKTKKMKKDEGCRKVNSNSPVKYSDQNSQELSPAKNYSHTHPISLGNALDTTKSIKMDIDASKDHSYNDSFNGLLDVPLFERIKSMPKGLLQNYEASYPRIIDNVNETVDLLFSDSLNFSKYSPLLSTCSTLNVEKRNNACMNANIYEKLNLSVKMSSFDKIISCNDSLNISYGLLHHTNCNPNLDINRDSKIENMDISIDEIKISTPKPEVNVVDVVKSLDVKNVICLDFSDSDDSDGSFLTLLSQRQKYSEDYAFNPQCIKLEKDAPNKHTCSTKIGIKSSKQDNFGFNLQNILTPLKRETNLSPSVLYSVKHSSSRTEKKICPRHLFFEIFNNSSPEIVAQNTLGKNLASTPNSSKMFSHALYSPLVFDSSTDEL